MTFKAKRTMGTRIVLVAAGIAAAAMAGIAGGALKVKSAETSIASNGFGSVTAKCKQGTRAVSGGFDAPDTGAVQTGPRGQAYVSTRSGRRGWLAAAENSGDVVAADWIGFVYCSDSLPKLKAKSKTTSIGLDESDSVSARCPKGGEAVSGGFITQEEDEDTDPFPFESRRVGKRKWQVSAINFRPEPAEFTAIAYCAKEKLGLKTRSATSTVTENGEVVSAEARCKKGTKALSGGFSGLFAYPVGDFLETYPFQSMRSGGRRWSAAAAGYASGGQSVDWTAFAYCLDKDELK